MCLFLSFVLSFLLCLFVGLFVCLLFDCLFDFCVCVLTDSFVCVVSLLVFVCFANLFVRLFCGFSVACLCQQTNKCPCRRCENARRGGGGGGGMVLSVGNVT